MHERPLLAGLALAAFLVAYNQLACTGGGSGGPDAGSDAAGDAGSDRGRDAPGEAASGAPFLTALSVTGSSPSLALIPTFSRSIHDYYVQCGEGMNALDVAMTASPGADSVLVAPTPSAAKPKQTVEVDVAENDAIIAAATNGAGTTEYWIRCLPHDFPQYVFTPHPEAGTVTPGYYLVGGLFTVPGSTGYAMILDGNGVPIWYVSTGTRFGAANVDSLTPGSLSFVPFSLLDPYETRDLATGATATVGPSAYTTDMHELRLLENGDYLVFAHPFASGADLTGVPVEEPDGGTTLGGPGATIYDCAVLEITPAGQVVWDWFASQHFVPKEVTSLAEPLNLLPDGGAFDGGIAYDVFHCNAIDVEPKTGNLLVSARDMDSIFYIDRTTKSVLWKMGGSDASVDDAAYVSVPDPFRKQHDARLLPGWSSDCGGSGKISLFDDESYTPNPARAVVYDVTVGGGDGGACEGGSAAGVAKKSWEYSGKGTNAAMDSAALGSFRISPDGSRVIGWGLVPLMGFSEVDDGGHDLLDFTFAANSTYRAIKVPESNFDRSVLRKTAGLR